MSREKWEAIKGDVAILEEVTPLGDGFDERVNKAKITIQVGAWKWASRRRRALEGKEEGDVR